MTNPTGTVTGVVLVAVTAFVVDTSLSNTSLAAHLGRIHAISPTGWLAQADGSVLYFGFYTTLAGEEFTGISFNNSNTNDFFGFDDMTIGSLEQVSPTPAPPGLVLAGIAAVCLFGYTGWRRRLACPQAA